MDTSEYFQTNNDVAEVVIAALLALLMLWLVLWVLSMYRLLHSQRQLRKHVNAGHVLMKLAAEHREVDAAQSSLPAPGAATAIFDRFLKTSALDADDSLSRHLRAIFEAGWNDSRLDVPALLKHTTEELLRGHALLRTLLSLFIILGVFGTLFGLADTLATIEVLLQDALQRPEANLGEQLRTVLGTLKSAFAPSLCGVGLTVICSLLISLYHRMVVLPFIGRLEHTTLTAWVPQLIPTIQQKSLSNIIRTQKTIESVAQLAEDIEDRSSTLNEALAQATDQLGRMTRTSEHLHQFSQRFVDGVTALMAFSHELPSLYQQLAVDLQTFHAELKQSISSALEFQKQIHQRLDMQQAQFSHFEGSLRSYEEAYLSSRQAIDAKLQAVLDQAAHAFASLSTRNEELVRCMDHAIGSPLRAELGTALSGVQNGLRALHDVQLKQLNELALRIGALDAPLQRSAEYFADTFVNFNEQTQAWWKELQTQFSNQNQYSQRQVERLILLSEQTPQLLRSLTESSIQFGVASGHFSQRDTQLSVEVATLSSAMAAFNQNVQSLGEWIQRLAVSTHARAHETMPTARAQTTPMPLAGNEALPVSWLARLSRWFPRKS